MEEAADDGVAVVAIVAGFKALRPLSFFSLRDCGCDEVRGGLLRWLNRVWLSLVRTCVGVLGRIFEVVVLEYRSSPSSKV